MNEAYSDELLLRVQGEYREMPGLRLTFAQAQRLWGLDRSTCEVLMKRLVEANVLRVTRDGTFVQLDPNSPAGFSGSGRVPRRVRDVHLPLPTAPPA
jgi:hypothetical protein